MMKQKKKKFKPLRFEKEKSEHGYVKERKENNWHSEKNNKRYYEKNMRQPSERK